MIGRVIFILFLIFILIPYPAVKAEKQTVQDILTTNLEKSTDYFYKNTSKDLENHYKRQFDFYINIGKNLISVKNITSVFDNFSKLILIELSRLQTNINKYINLITPSEYK